MIEPRSAPVTAPPGPAPVLLSFFQRLGPLEGLVRIILKDARLSARLAFRGDPAGVVRLDFTGRPARIETELGGGDGRGPALPPGRIQVSIDARVMHEVLLGRLSPGEALGRRELLLRGNAAELARFIPLLEFAPVLYREHLADLGDPQFARPGLRTGASPLEEDPMAPARFQGNPIPLRRLSGPERATFRVIKEAAWAAGYGVGLLRHRFLQSLSLFEVLEALSKGVEAAASRPRRGSAARPEAGAP